MRFFVFALVAVTAGLSLYFGLATGSLWWWGLGALSLFLTGVGTNDLIQRRHSVWRNYPIIGHIRWMLEAIRPELRQYLFASDKDDGPFNRAQRSLVYQRAKEEEDRQPFGSRLDHYDPSAAWLTYSLKPAVPCPDKYRVMVGQGQCAKPYSASILNVSAMSYGSLSGSAIRALNRGARMGNFAHDTGEGGISRYHRMEGGDLIWELGTGYFGCRTDDGRFDPEKFAEKARDDQVKMIEVKLSQGAKPGHGGILPGQKVTAEIAEARGVPEGQDCVSPPAHSAFSTPLELCEFMDRLRRLSGGKPVGFKLCVGHQWEFVAILKAMIETGKPADFIVVDGSEGGTGAAPIEFADYLGMPLQEGLTFVHNCLVAAGLRDRVRVGAAGKVTSSFDIVRLLSLGADWTNAARAFMFSVGCIQSLSCHTNRCPVGVATQDPARERALDVDDKGVRAFRFHRNTLHALGELISAAGYAHPGDVPRGIVWRRDGNGRALTGEQRFDWLATGAFLDAGALGTLPKMYRQAWQSASAQQFSPVQEA